MNQKSIRLTTAQFAKLHGINKRTLHYYDSIGLFTPQEKGDNNYRYYDSAQSIEFEYILMLKELNMSIDEIKRYVNNPNSHDFIAIVDEKTNEIESQIAKLERTKKMLQTKKEQLLLCAAASNKGIHIINCGQEKILTIPFDFKEDDLKKIFIYIKDVWDCEQYRAGIGSYISVDKIKNNNFDEYDGLFTPALKNQRKEKAIIKPKGRYLCCYAKGTWDRLPAAYRQMLCYAKEHGLELTGYAYEKGMNDFVIQSESDYVTQITIKIEGKS